MPLASLILAGMAGPSVALFATTPNLSFPEVGKETRIELPTIKPAQAFNEAIVSWNVVPAAGTSIRVEARAKGDGFVTGWYTVAEWQLDDPSKRVTFKDQKDEHGVMDTDTLTLNKLANGLDVAVTMRRLAPGPTPVLKLLTVSTANTKSTPPSITQPNAAWGKLVDVPQRAQGIYPRGSVLCSPTSLSMVLWHYSNKLNRPELNKDVPEVEASVWDKVYDGAGNWPFNTAYAGSFPGITAYVTRMRGIQDLERWIDAGLPVICSVSLDILMGKPNPRASGHLVVLVGFEKNGDPIFNDPAHRDQVRRTYTRENFEKAWLRSNRTVYIVHPDDAKVPRESDSVWYVPK